MIGEERILGKFSCEGCRRPSGAAETLLVARSEAPVLWNTPGEYALWGGGGDR